MCLLTAVGYASVLRFAFVGGLAVSLSRPVALRTDLAVGVHFVGRMVLTRPRLAADACARWDVQCRSSSSGGPSPAWLGAVAPFRSSLCCTSAVRLIGGNNRVCRPLKAPATNKSKTRSGRRCPDDWTGECMRRVTGPDGQNSLCPF